MNKDMEVWKDIPNYEGYYQVSNLGRVRSLDRIITNGWGTTSNLKGKFISIKENNKGYPVAHLSVEGVAKKRRVHQLVAKVFMNHSTSNSNMVIDHIDGNRSNNTVSNLRIVTNRENSTTCYRKGKEDYISPYVGVGWSKKHCKWTSRITFNGRRFFLGCFDSEIDAHNQYQLALIEIVNGDFNKSKYEPTYSSKYTGVYFYKPRNNWRAIITVEGRRTIIGNFKTEEMALNARIEAEERLKKKS